jgi:hypothetical protein
MPGASLTAASTLVCPHGGTVMITPANQRATAQGAPIATSADVCTIAGCAFTIPPGVPSPCVTVQWMVSAMRLKAGAPALDAASVGICIAATGAPQGPVIVQATQPRVKDL